MEKEVKERKLFASNAPKPVLQRLRLEAYRRGMRQSDLIAEILHKALPQRIEIVADPEERV